MRMIPVQRITLIQPTAAEPRAKFSLTLAHGQMLDADLQAVEQFRGSLLSAYRLGAVLGLQLRSVSRGEIFLPSVRVDISGSLVPSEDLALMRTRWELYSGPDHPLSRRLYPQLSTLHSVGDFHTRAPVIAQLAVETL